MATLYENIKALCEKKGVTVSRMCIDMGVSKSTMSDLKSGKKKSMTIPTLERIAKYLDTTVDEIINGTWQGNMDREMRGYRMGREDEKKHSDQWMDEELKECLEVLRDRPDTRALLHASRDMTPEQVAKMAEFMRSMKGAENAD